MCCNEKISLAIWCPQCVVGPYGFDGHGRLGLYLLTRTSRKPGIVFRCRDCGCYWRRTLGPRARFDWMPLAWRRTRE